MRHTNILLARSLNKIRSFTNEFEMSETLKVDGKWMSLFEFSARNYSSQDRNLLVGLDVSICSGQDFLDDYEIIDVPKFTRGALMTLAWAVNALDDDEAFVVAPIDGIVLTNVKKFAQSMSEDGVQIGLIAFHSDNPNFSYLRLKGEEIIEFAEKEVIGSLATSGIFYFQNKQILLQCIEWSLLNNVSREGLYYLAPSLNYAIAENMKIGLWEVAADDYFRFSNQDEFQNTLERLRKRNAN